LCQEVFNTIKAWCQTTCYQLSWSQLASLWLQELYIYQDLQTWCCYNITGATSCLSVIMNANTTSASMIAEKDLNELTWLLSEFEEVKKHTSKLLFKTTHVKFLPHWGFEHIFNVVSIIPAIMHLLSSGLLRLLAHVGWGVWNSHHGFSSLLHSLFIWCCIQE